MFESNKDNLENIKDDTKEFSEKLKDSALDMGQVVKEQITTSGKEVFDKTTEVKDQLVTWMGNNPLKSAGIAFVLGWLYSKTLCPISNK